ncbi:unnamed protein product [Blepharisma stoltei]|uniref:RING-type domain-containing protein n=1 Tax=Blepharisma stoltei TaxID=1481888 RepID=A0AAU9JL09_9CILI|nr:unnamed protein product [Blepharisma stoltei]
MIKIILLFFIAVFCRLRIWYPPELYKLYPSNIVPSVTANLRKSPRHSEGNVKFLPNDINPCDEDSSPEFFNGTVVAIENITCDYSTVIRIAQEKLAIGVIFVLNLPDSKLNEHLISAGSETYKFVAGISNEHIDKWKEIKEGEIFIEFDRDWIYTWHRPTISISLTGNYNYDADFIKEWYLFLIPIYEGDVYIDLFFNYSFSCSDCSPNDCYSNNKYCMIDGVNHAKGRDMIDRTLLEMALLDYTKYHDLYLGVFAMFLYELGNSCSNDYSENCSRNVLNWLKVDYEEIQGRIKSSWISDMNDQYADNSILSKQYDGWADKSYFKPIPSITIGDITLGLNQGYGFQTYICNYFYFYYSSSTNLCDDKCTYTCFIWYLNNGYCDVGCKTDSCFNDIQDCNSLHDFCDDVHNHACSYSYGGDEGLSKKSIILIAFGCFGFCLLFVFCCVYCNYFCKYLAARKREQENQNPSSSEDEIGSERSRPLDNSPEIRISIQNESENNSDYGFFGDATCSICFNAITEENMKVTKCKHIFHKDCLKAWTDAKGRNAKCPNCNEEIH